MQISILDIIFDMSGKRIGKSINNGYDDKTQYIGTGDGRVKIYNKKKESDLNIFGDLTRIEISRHIDDYDIRYIKYYKYDNIFPSLYLQNYIYSLSDYKDKTLLAILYAVQAGYPIRDLSVCYRKKIKNLLEGGYKIKFDNKIVTDVIRQTIFYYFIGNYKVIWI